MVFGPTANWLPKSTAVAVAALPDGITLALPKAVCPRMKSTEPSGQAAPQAGVTVTVMVVVPLAARVAGSATTVVVVATVPPVVHPVEGVPVHSRTRLFTSTDPSPVAWSYPGLAL